MNKATSLFFLIAFLYSCSSNDNIEVTKEFPNGDPEVVIVKTPNSDTYSIISYYESGKVERISHYANGGIKDGTDISYFENGDTARLRIYKNDTLDGKSIGWYSKNKPNYISVYEMGKEISGGEYYENGQIMGKINYINGKVDGKAVYFHEDGSIRIEGFYQTDKPCGIWKEYNTKGELIKVDTLRN
jgi:antitoxin component YwqK of YwqJK toxin-antitoxin module